MNTNNQLETTAKELFAANSDLELLFITSDQQGFHLETDAVNHARHLKDKIVLPVYRDKGSKGRLKQKAAEKELQRKQASGVIYKPTFKATGK